MWVMDEPDLDKRSELILAFNKESMSKEAQEDLAWQKYQEMQDPR